MMHTSAKYRAQIKYWVRVTKGLYTQNTHILKLKSSQNSRCTSNLKLIDKFEIFWNIWRDIIEIT